jgi:hypothetical protein
VIFSSLLFLFHNGKLTFSAVSQLCCYRFGLKADELPHPEADFREFIRVVNEHNEREHMVWNAKTRSLQRWVVMPKLQSMYGKKAAGCVIN